MTTPVRTSRALAAALAAALPLSACGGTGDSARMGQLIWQSVSGGPGAKITREQAAAVPYASMGVEVGNGDQGLLVLGTTSPAQSEWYAGDSVMIRTRQGRVVRTAGLPYDLGGLELRQPPGAAPGGRYALIFDLPDMGVFGAVATCSERDAGPATIDILGTRIQTRRHVEHCDVPTLEWDFDSEFWRDPATDFVWRSRQYIHPKSPPVTLEVFRPEAAG